MGGGHCLICYFLITNANTFNSSINPLDCVSLCKLLQLPVEAFSVILSRSLTCPECTKGLQKGAQFIKRFEKLQEELSQLRTNFQNKLIKAQKLSLDLNDLEDCHKERSSIIKELNLNINSSEGDAPSTEFEDDDLHFQDDLDLNQEIPQEDAPSPNANEFEQLGSVQTSSNISQPNVIMNAKDLKVLPLGHVLPTLIKSQGSGQRTPKAPMGNINVIVKVPLLKLNKLDLSQGVTRIKNIHDLHLPNINSASTSNFKLEYFCLTCSHNFKEHSGLALHQRHYDHSLKIYKCCSETFPTLNDLEVHKKTVHEKHKPRPRKKKTKVKKPCTECGGYFTQLGSHIKFVHKKLRPFVCTWEGCSNAYRDARTLRTHIAKAHEKISQTFLCETCAKSFASRDILRGHKKRVHDPKTESFMCDQCSKIFQIKCDLKSHIKAVHEHEHILCYLCGFELKHKRQYKDHLKWHEIKGDKFSPRNRSCYKKNPPVKPKVD